MLGKDSQERTARTGQPEKAFGMVQAGQEREDRMARTGQKGRVAGTRKLRYDNCT
jgi:hypothetical protein